MNADYEGMDAFQIGEALKRKEQGERRFRITQALTSYTYNGFTPPERRAIVRALARAAYDGLEYDAVTQEPVERTPEEILNNFCWDVFGCWFNEALEAEAESVTPLTEQGV